MTASRHLAAIMFADVPEFTLRAQTNESEALDRLRELEATIRPVIPQHGGRHVKSTGDGFLAVFESALKATECAIEIQRVLHERNSRSSGAVIQLRIGVHLGDLEEREGDIFGDAVNIAARIEPQAEAGGICISEQVYDQVRNKLGNALVKLPGRELKNVRVPIDVYKVVVPWNEEEAPVKGPTIPRLAVLPLANISPDPKDEYFADGLTEELITVLSQLKGIQVIARTSVVPYKSNPKPIPQVGTELGANWVLEGSVRKAGDQLRITAQLIDVVSQSHAWSGTYDRKLDDIFELQSDVAKRIAEALQVKLGKAEERRLDDRPTVRPDSYLAYLRGRSLHSSQSTEAGLRAAKAQFELATSLDPTNARAYSGLADVTGQLGLWHFEGLREEWTRTRRDYVARAVELDPDLAEARCSLGVMLWNDNDWAGAERELTRGLALNPSYALGHRYYSGILLEEGRPEEALRESELAVELDPQSRNYLADHVSILSWLRRSDAAEPFLERIKRLAPDSTQYHEALAWWYYARGDLRRSIEEVERILALEPSSMRTPLAWLRALLGERDTARQILEAEIQRSDRVPPAYAIAVGYAFLNDFDEAFRIMLEAAHAHELDLEMIRTDVALEPLRRDPRFSQILKMSNLS